MERKALWAVADEVALICAGGTGTLLQQRLAGLVQQRRLSLSDLLAILDILEAAARPIGRRRAP